MGTTHRRSGWTTVKAVSSLRRIVALALSAATLVPVLALSPSALATSDPCTGKTSKLACLNSTVTAAQVSDRLAASHRIVALPSSTQPTLAYLSNTVSGMMSFYMPAGRCNNAARSADTGAASVADCTFGNSRASAANTIVLTGDSRAMMWATAYAKLATVLNWRLIVLSKPGCVAQTGALTYLNVPGRPGPWIACDRFRSAVIADIASIKPALVVVASNPAASLADGRRTSQSTSLAHDNTYDYLHQLKNASTTSTFVALTGFPLLVNVGAGVANPVACVAAHKKDVRVCDIKSNNSTNDDPTNVAVTQAAVDAGYATINQKPWMCNVTCPAVVDKMLPYARDGLHVDNVYSVWLMGVMWRSLAAVPNSPISLPTN